MTYMWSRNFLRDRILEQACEWSRNFCCNTNGYVTYNAKNQESLNNLKKTKGRYRAVRLCTLFPGRLLGAGILGFRYDFVWIALRFLLGGTI